MTTAKTTTTTTATTTMEHLTERARVLAERREHLLELVAELKKAQDELETDNMPAIREAVNAATQAWLALEQQVRDHPHLFETPRTVKAHGISFGLEKGVGAVVLDDETRTVALVRKHFPEQFDELVETSHKPRKTALARLSAADLKRLGGRIEGTGDRVVIRVPKSATDKLVQALIKNAADEGAAA
jgi:hypothetical protein